MLTFSPLPSLGIPIRVAFYMYYLGEPDWGVLSGISSNFTYKSEYRIPFLFLIFSWISSLLPLTAFTVIACVSRERR